MNSQDSIPLTQRQRNLEPLGELLSVSGRLQLLGWRSVAAWAMAYGYEPRTVRQVIYRWGARTEEPHGGLGRQIMRDLRVTLDDGLRAA